MRSRKGGAKPRRQHLQVLVNNIIQHQHEDELNRDFCPDCGLANCTGLI